MARFNGIAIIIMLAMSAFLIGSPAAGAAPVGSVCILPIGLSVCSSFPPTIYGVFGTQLKVSIFVQGSDALGGFEVVLLASHTVLTPVGIDLTGTVLPGTATIQQECLGGLLVVGNSCPATDTIDTLDLQATGGLNLLTASPITGLLFTAIYNVTGISSNLPFGYQTGCAGTSVANICITISGAGASPLIETAQPAIFSDSPAADRFSDSSYYTGANSMINSLYGPAPCGSGLSSLHEAPSYPYNFWSDDSAKFLGSLSPVASTYSTQTDNSIRFLNYLNLGGYMPSRCVQISPFITDPSLASPNVGNNLYILRGNPTLSQSDPNHIFSVSERMNPTISQAYMISTVASINDVLVNMDTGRANPIRNPGNDAPIPLDKWTVNATVGSSVLYYHSPIRSFALFSRANLTQVIQAAYISSTFFIDSFTWWDTDNLASQGYSAIVYYTDGTRSTFAQTAAFSASPGTWSQKTILGSSMSPGKSVKSIGFTTGAFGANSTSVYLDDISMNIIVGTPTFTVATNGPSVVETETLTFSGISISLSYILQPGKPYVLLTSSIYNGGIVNITRPTIYNAFDGMDTIGSGYAYLYLPGVGFMRPNQSNNLVTQAFSLNGWNDNWLAFDVHGNPDWIGTNSIFVNFDPSQMPQGAGPWRLNQVTNTIFQDSTTLGPTNYLHWAQMSINNANNVTVGSTASYNLKYVFALAHDWTNMGVYANYFSGNNLDNWNNVYPSMNFYEGEIAYEAAVYAQATGGVNSLSYPLAVSVWNYYNRMIQAESNGTYTGSLSRFVDASIVLNQITGDSAYITGMKIASTLLLKDQYNLCCFLNTTRYNFHYCPTGCATINTLSTFGDIFNQTTLWGSGRVLSGASVNVNFFQSPALARTQNVSGTFSSIFWMNANTASLTGYYYTQLFRVSSGGTATLMAQSANQTITLPAGSGAAPFRAFTSSMSVNVNVPSGSALEVNLQVKVAGGNTAYVCFDSAVNCPSYLLDPDNIIAQGKGGFRILPVANQSPTAVPQTQPIFLDLTALAGRALFDANVISPNSTYVISYTAAIKAIRWGNTPVGSGQVTGDHANILGGAPNAAPRLYVWANATYIDVDFSTYKAGVTVLFALPLNQTLANIAISRLWDRVYMPNPPSPASLIQVDTGEAQPLSSGEMNSETQPWGLITWFTYTNFYRATLINGNSPQFIVFSNLRDTLQSVSATLTTVTLTVNGTGTHTIYVYNKNLAINQVVFNLTPIPFTFSNDGKGPLPGYDYVYFGHAWTISGIFVLSGIVNNNLVFTITPGWPVYEAQGSWALNDILVSLAPQSGSLNNVTLVCPVLPIGVSCAFSPAIGVPTFHSALNMSSSRRTPAGVYNITIIGTGGGALATASFSLIVVPVGTSQLFVDDFVQQSILPSSSWTMDWNGYGNPSQNSPGNSRVNSGNLDIYSGEVHVNSPGLFDPAGVANNTLIVRKLTVGLVPFATTSSSVDIVQAGWGPLISGTRGQGFDNIPCLPLVDNTGVPGCFVLSGAPGGASISVDGVGHATAEFCGGQGFPCKHFAIGIINPHIYTVLTIKYQILFPGPVGQNWITFRVYQTGPNGNSFDSTLAFTYVNTDYHLINPTAGREYAAINCLCNFDIRPVRDEFSAIDIVQWQDFGSPVLLTPPPRIPFPTAITGNGLIGLLLLVATSLGFGDPQLGIFLEFLMFIAATAFPIALFTRSLLSTATVVLVISAMFVYAGFLPTLIIFIEMIAVAGLAFMTFQRIISGGGGQSYLGAESEE